MPTGEGGAVVLGVVGAADLTKRIAIDFRLLGEVVEILLEIEPSFPRFHAGGEVFGEI